jgi:hypothetical protein
LSSINIKVHSPGENSISENRLGDVISRRGQMDPPGFLRFGTEFRVFALALALALAVVDCFPKSLRGGS